MSRENKNLREAISYEIAHYLQCDYRNLKKLTLEELREKKRKIATERYRLIEKLKREQVEPYEAIHSEGNYVLDGIKHRLCITCLEKMTKKQLIKEINRKSRMSEYDEKRDSLILSIERLAYTDQRAFKDSRKILPSFKPVDKILERYRAECLEELTTEQLEQGARR